MGLNKYILLFLCLFIFTSCDENNLGTNIGTEDPLESQANILNGTWDLEPLSEKPSIKDVTPVTKDGMEVQIFNNMTPHHIRGFCRRWYLLYSKHLR